MLEFHVTAEQLTAAEPLLKIVIAETLEHFAAAVEGLVSVEVRDPRVWVVAILFL